MLCGRPINKGTQEVSNRDAYLEFYSSSEYCDECKSYANSAKKHLKINNTFHISTEVSHITQGKALYLYYGDIKKTMYRFKYSNRREYAKYFAKQAVERYGEWIEKKHIQAIVPVPMYLAKERKRGYNQAACFAKELSVLTGIPMETKLVHRIKNTRPLKELNRVERKNNLKNAFQKGKSIVQYSHILVVDDIYTTGSTAQAVAEELNKKGINHVYFMSICMGETM